MLIWLVLQQLVTSVKYKEPNHVHKPQLRCNLGTVQERIHDYARKVALHLKMFIRKSDVLHLSQFHYELQLALYRRTTQLQYLSATLYLVWLTLLYWLTLVGK